MGRADSKALNRLRFVHTYRDRHGKVRRYFRRGSEPKVTLPSDMESEEFLTAYANALKGNGAASKESAEKTVEAAKRGAVGSIASAVAGYQASTDFCNLAAETRRTRRNILKRFSDAYGTGTVRNLSTVHVDALIAKMADRPSAARNYLATLRALMAYCVKVKLRSDDPTTGIKSAPIKTSGYYSWTEVDIDGFKAKHPAGTRARMALELALCTAQRRGDIVLMGRQHLRDGGLYVKQQKTGAELLIPVHPDLQAEIDAMPAGQMTFLVTHFGKPFSPAGFTNWFRDCCNDAGLPKGVSVHGLRKAQCRRLADAGCSTHEIQSISGHLTLEEVETYTKAANQKRLAKSAMTTVTAAFSSKRT